MIKKILILLLVLIIIITGVGCREKQLKIIGSDELEVGTSIVLTHNFDKSEQEIWNSSDTNIAEVYDGMVIANNVGAVTITLIVNESIATKEIQVIPSKIQIAILGENNVLVGESITLNAQLPNGIEEEIVWKSEDETIAKVNQNGLVKGIKPGKVKIYASIMNDTIKNEFVLAVIPSDCSISIVGKNVIAVNEQFQFDYNDGFDNLLDVKWSVSNESIASISSDGLFKGLQEGKVIVKVESISNMNIFSTFEVNIVLSAPSKISISGNSNLVQGELINLVVNVKEDNVTKEVVWTSSNPQVALVYQGIVLGVKAGTTVIKATSILDETVYGTIELTVNKYEAEPVQDANLEKVNQIIDSMSLSQKIGQMFVVGFNGTSMPSDLANVIKNYNFGNVIYLARNVSNPNTLSQMTNDIQNLMVKENKVPGYITIDQEGGRVVRLTNGGTHFISNMAMAATNDVNNSYLEGQAIGKELKNYGINCNFAPVLDVNNNPENPIIGIRSYSDNPVLVALYGNQLIKGLKKTDVIACSKHFPGHGNTSVDSHYGLPTITSSYEELYQIEFAPFLSAIANGIDAIMTTHIIFSAIDDKYPATLSEKVLTNFLREELGFNGVIFTDGMEMGAVTKNFGGYDKTAVMAIKAGADVLTYTSFNTPITAHQALMNAVEIGQITEERINESVRRILLMKLEYGLLDNYLAKNENISQLLSDNEQMNINFAMQSLTQVIGEFDGLNKSKSTLIISPTTAYDLGKGLNSNSFANYACNYLKTKGHTKVDYINVDNNMTSSQVNQILNVYQNYDQIVIAMSNVKTSNYKETINLVNKVVINHKNVIVIALDTPYDLLSYSNVNNYICVYGYQKASVIALSKYLNGEFKATGKSSIDENIFK